MRDDSSDSHEVTRLRLEVIRLQFELGVMSAELAKAETKINMLLRSNLQDSETMLADAIRKAAAK